MSPDPMFEDVPQERHSATAQPGEIDALRSSNIKTQLDLMLLALESLAGISSEAMLKTAAQLGLQEAIGDRVTLWRLRQSSPLRNSQGGRKKLDVEEARSLVLLVGALARDQHELIRRAVALLEQYAALDRPPHEASLLGDYLDRFTHAYQERMVGGDRASPALLEQLALKLLLDLLFYSGPDGSRRLWLSLFDRASGTEFSRTSGAEFFRATGTPSPRSTTEPPSRSKTPPT